MSHFKAIHSALISVYYKEGLTELILELQKNNVVLYSTGGTLKYIESLNIPVIPVESLTNFPEILGGRVKTLHPTIFGGILNRRDNESDRLESKSHGIPDIDLVIVDLYPFEETVLSGASENEVIEKIDIGGISLIRAAAKNYKDVVIIPSVKYYSELLELLISQNGATSIEQRKKFATEAFHVTSHYDNLIHAYFSDYKSAYFKESILKYEDLRYGENPHQEGKFFGNLDLIFDKLHGKELSYNNLLDVDAAVSLMQEFENEGPTFAILKHNNACGLATRPTIKEAYISALEADPVSAFGGILISNTKIDFSTAELINQLFCEVLIAPEYDFECVELLKSKKNRIILLQKEVKLPLRQFRTILNGVLVQERDKISETRNELELKTIHAPSEDEINDLLFANKLAKHTKSNTIVLVKNKQLLASGTGQTSRVDALNQAIHKAKAFQFDLKGAVMASDAFFPFPDCVEIANEEGINAVIQPGGSLKDQLSIDFCNKEKMKMVFTGIRHFKH